MRITRLTLLFMLASVATAAAQLPTDVYRGVTDLGLELRKLATTKSVLVIGAHPDDEDNQLLSYLSLGDGASVAYLSLTRGEGGQNSIGGELGPALGVLRTGELLAARGVDRSRQYFTRAYDFGFSKTAEESFQHWPRDSVLADVVSIVRRVRPDVIVAIFTGTPRDGHGQHQVSGILAREAFVAAADPNRFPEQIRSGLRPHRTQKLFQATGYQQADPSERFATGQLDALFGRSYAQLAALSRSRHRSQDMGMAQPLGPRTTSVRLLRSNVPISDSTLFSGIDTTLSAHAAAVHESTAVVRALLKYDSLVASAKQQLSAYGNPRTPVLIAAALRTLADVRPSIRDVDLAEDVSNKIELANRAFLDAADIVIDAVADADLIVPGSVFDLDLTVWNGGDQPLTLVQLEPALPPNWNAQRTDSTGNTIAAGAITTRRFRVTVPSDAKVSQPYFLVTPRPGDYYAWPSQQPYAGLPFQAPEVNALAAVDVLGTQARTIVAATQRVIDPRQGEIRRAVHVAPAFVLRADPSTSVITLASLASGSRNSINVSVEVLSNGEGGTVTVRPRLPSAWHASPEAVSISLHERGEAATAKFAIEPPRNVPAGSYDIAFEAVGTDSTVYDLTQRIVDYPHIANQVMYEPALLHVTALDAKFARGMRVGYVVGVDAPIAQVLEQMGVTVERLDEADLANGELGIYDAIVVGSRAYEIRPDLIAHNARLLDYARHGGNLIVLYQQYEFIRGGFAPYSMSIAQPHDRVTDENAPVRLLDSAATALSRPNRIGQRDFTGWVQERSLYMPHTWAPEYTPLLEMHDPGEAPQQGAILVAPLGSGTYTYTGISFFREIPAGVPGALRLFINLLSQGIKDVTF